MNMASVLGVSLLGLLGSFFLINTYHHAWKIHASRNWPTTPVTEIEMNKIQRYCYLKYSYNVDGVEFKFKELGIRTYSCSDLKSLQEEVRERKLSCYYNPKHPKTSLLSRKIMNNDLSKNTFAGSFLINISPLFLSMLDHNQFLGIYASTGAFFFIFSTTFAIYTRSSVFIAALLPVILFFLGSMLKESNAFKRYFDNSAELERIEQRFLNTAIKGERRLPSPLSEESGLLTSHRKEKSLEDALAQAENV